MRNRGTTGLPAAFTLIELLVVVAIIALLLSILLPSLRGAREQARMVTCGQRLHDFGMGLATYMTENGEWIPGINTSGVAIRALDLVWGADPGVLNEPTLPVQPWDWMTPIMAHQVELPAVRARRFKFLLDGLRCPSQPYHSALYLEGGAPPDLAALQAEAPFRTISYLMPVHFQAVGQTYNNRLILGYKVHPAVTNRPVYALAAPATWEVTNQDYLPQLVNIGDPSRKIFVADGTRYLSVQGGAEDLDFDAHPAGAFSGAQSHVFGSFTDAGAWWCGSTAYGVEQGSVNWDGMTVNAGQYPPGRGRNLALSYRHGPAGSRITSSAQSNSGLINALMFDGHVQRMNDRQSREIYYWYPKGSVVRNPAQGMTSVPQDFEVP